MKGSWDGHEQIVVLEIGNDRPGKMSKDFTTNQSNVAIKSPVGQPLVVATGLRVKANHLPVRDLLRVEEDDQCRFAYISTKVTADGDDRDRAKNRGRVTHIAIKQPAQGAVQNT
jgi:hypothetical protein